MESQVSSKYTGKESHITKYTDKESLYADKESGVIKMPL